MQNVLKHTCWDRFRANHLLFLLTLLVTAVFLVAGTMKSTGNPMMAMIFENRYGLPLWFMFFIGYAEVFGALSLWLKRWALPGALGLLVIGAGASVTHIVLGDGPDMAGMAWGVTAGVLIIAIYHWRAAAAEED